MLRSRAAETLLHGLTNRKSSTSERKGTGKGSCGAFLAGKAGGRTGGTAPMLFAHGSAGMEHPMARVEETFSGVPANTAANASCKSSCVAAGRVLPSSM